VATHAASTERECHAVISSPGADENMGENFFPNGYSAHEAIETGYRNAAHKIEHRHNAGLDKPREHPTRTSLAEGADGDRHQVSRHMYRRGNYRGPSPFWTLPRAQVRQMRSSLWQESQLDNAPLASTWYNRLMEGLSEGAQMPSMLGNIQNGGIDQTASHASMLAKTIAANATGSADRPASQGRARELRLELKPWHSVSNPTHAHANICQAIAAKTSPTTSSGGEWVEENKHVSAKEPTSRGDHARKVCEASELRPRATHRSSSLPPSFSFSPPPLPSPVVPLVAAPVVWGLMLGSVPSCNHNGEGTSWAPSLTQRA